MATKITSEVLESYLHCKFKGHLKLAGQQGTKCDFEAMLTELRAELRLKAIDTIIARHPEDQERDDERRPREHEERGQRARVEYDHCDDGLPVDTPGPLSVRR